MKAKFYKKWLLVTLFSLFILPTFSAKIVYVSTTGNGTNDGLSWSSPKLTLAQAYALCVAGDQIWVKAGTYPQPTAALAVILTNISIYGGFDGTETTLAQRNWVVNKTILDGGNAKQLFYTGSSSGTSYDASNLLIDGFTMQNGYGPNGGAIIFAGNLSSNILVQNCIFRNNAATTNGGAISVSNGNSVSFYNCLFMNNQCGALASAVNATATATAKFYNCTFVNNANLKSGGGSLFQFAGTNNTLVNCVLWNNKNTTVTPTPTNSSVTTTGTSPLINYIASDVTVSIATNSITLNATNTDVAGPNFKNPGSTIGMVADVTTLDAFDYSLASASPCIDKGDNSSVVGSTDLAMNTRISDVTVDMGAYELPFYNTTITFNSGGTVSAYSSGTIISNPLGKSDLSYIITPNQGMGIQSILYNGTEVKSQLTNLLGSSVYYGGTYTAPALMGNSTLVVTFEVDLTTSLSKVMSNFNYWVNNNSIELRDLKVGELLNVYDIAGNQMFNRKIANSTETISLSKGVYLVKIANSTKKVIVF